LLTGGFRCRASEVTVFAAASLTDSLREIATNWEQQTGNKVLFNFGASSTLARQIREGAPADIFFSADEAQMNALETNGLILKETRQSRLRNSLVIVVATDSKMTIHSPEDLAGAEIKRVALADTKAVPAGVYSREYLVKLKLWQRVEPKVIPMENVRAALGAVESGNVDAGMVYKTDAAISRKVKIAFAVKPEEGPDISYPVALVKQAKSSAAALELREYLNSKSAGKVFEKSGFIVRD